MERFKHQENKNSIFQDLFIPTKTKNGSHSMSQNYRNEEKIESLILDVTSTFL